MATIRIKRGLQEAVDRLALAQGELALALDTGNVYVGAQTGNIHLNPKGGTAEEAERLSTERKFSASGDVTAPAVAFDGSANVELVMTLADLAGLSAGTYTKVTVDGKGRVTGGSTLAVEDLPELPVEKVNGLGAAALLDTGKEAGKIPVLEAGGKLPAALLPDLSGTYVQSGTTVNGKALTEDVILTAEDVGAVAAEEKGVAGGVATLDENGRVPSAQLPSFVDDVREFETRAEFPEAGESGVIYIAKDTNLTYRWSGSLYVEISPSLALGETDATAFPGDKGKAAYDHSQITQGNPHGVGYQDVGAAPAGHVEQQASGQQLGHVKLGTGFTVNAEGSLELDSVDGGTFE